MPKANDLICYRWEEQSSMATQRMPLMTS